VTLKFVVTGRIAENSNAGAARHIISGFYFDLGSEIWLR
jgi:hypothetical protein